MTEHDELQGILSGAKEPKVAEGRFGVPWIKTARDLGQWMVEPNDCYCGTSQTHAQLPAGVYKTTVDDRGVIHFRRIPVLTDKIIDLHDPASDEIISDINKFWESEGSYNRLGMLYKRGILLWGPAGSGKTVTVTILMNKLISAGGVVLFCEDPSIITGALEELRKIEKDRRLIVVLEDIEEILEKHGEHTVLALLDGEHQVGNVVNIATTNYPERLGARIINRPSRFDRVKKIDMPNGNARFEYFQSTVPEDVGTTTLMKWVEDTEGLSIAHLRELVVAQFCLGEEYEYTIKRLKSMGNKRASGREFGTGVGMAPPKVNGKWGPAVEGYTRTWNPMADPAGLNLKRDSSGRLSKEGSAQVVNRVREMNRQLDEARSRVRLFRKKDE